ncbi:MAG: type I 3-dehydroquinate dehydratase [Phycisphaera sp.]|nr:MAG: type I 3-dehydroquinate dehydratase [Phycisphaera sp.]
MITLVCVPIAVDTPEQALADAQHAQLAGADLVEFRLDAFFEEASQIDACVKLVADSPLPCVATCRPSWEGGEYEGDEETRLALFQRLAEAEHAPRYIDIELATETKPDIGDGLILSTHDFEGRPSNLTRQLLQLRDSSATVHKIAFRARSLRDNIELFDILSHRDRPTIALGMGAYGLMSRVLAPKFGGFLTFASLKPESTTAPGQPTIAELLNLYRFKSITRTTKVFGIVGDPVEHSRSPAMHNAGFERIGFDGVYLPLPVAPGYESLKATLTELLAHDTLDLTGLSVTMPHKKSLVRLAREQGWLIDDLAERCGAANTLVRDGGTIRVMNTDGPAVVACLTNAGVELQGAPMLVLGAGGMAQAAAFALAEAGARVHIHNRTAERARELAARIDGATHLESLEKPSSMRAIVQCTPLGMAGGPAPGESPIPADALSDATIVETVYHPRETPLVRAATARGLRVIDGLDMLVTQAAAQFEAFTGSQAPIDLFRETAQAE